MAITALVIGVLSFFVCWVPYLGIAVSGLGLLLGVGGLVLAVVRRGSGVGFSIGGSGLSALSLVICLVWTIGLSRALKPLDDAVTKQPRTTDLASRVDRAAPLPVSDEVPRLDASRDAARVGDMAITVLSTRVGRVRERGLFDRTERDSSREYFVLRIRVDNHSQTRKISYYPFPSILGSGPQIRDEFGNSYHLLPEFVHREVVGHEGFESLYPGKSVEDVLLFDVPVERAGDLTLVLPAAIVDGKGTIRFLIPRAMWKKVSVRCRDVL